MKRFTRQTGLVAAATGVFALLLFLTVGGSTASAQGADDPARVDAGQTVFENNCSGCHGADGSGSATGRPLVGIASENDRDVHIASVADGKGRMPAFGSRLTEEEVADVVSFLRLTFVADEGAADDDDADEAAADDAPAAPALAKTGVESLQVVIIGIAMVLAGLMVLGTGRRSEV